MRPLLVLALCLAAGTASAQERRVHAYSIQSTSMEPTLRIDERVMADRRPDDCGDVEGVVPGDLIIRRRGEQRWISRVVAGAGQTVEVRGGRLILGGVPIDRISDGRAHLAGREGELFTEALATGRTWQIFIQDGDSSIDDMPRITIGPDQWFLLGDNRRNAVDSRIDGPVVSADVCGVVTHLFLSNDPSRVRPLR